ncbi:hypothetical protein BDV95DRAFT_572041 [Massariosphaeria phaeospora]|uniref:Zn(2)-C6 fungal-type domain-containing protein n=1 Tax=Massariosphaeria phaeospora TaxID=100035 RepID=A0A7C8MEN6_9PLEO|nr:hypothetical protein BDV95DRAFT_572041 [Massariosphaeria phaeospora]
MPSGIMQSCSRCRMQKRKCDRRLPICTLCERLKRPCSYPTFDEPPAVVPDPRELSCPTIRDTLHKQISAFVGNSQQVADWTAEYFRTIHLWLPVLSQTNFYTRLQSVQPETDSMDFSALILAMNLVCSKSVNAALTTPTRALYLLVKTLVSTLEADGVNSLEMVQARLLVTVFELGHGLYPAAYISAGANVRAAVDLGVNAGSDEQLVETFGSREIVEEAQKVWSGIIIADRSVRLRCSSVSGFRST